MRRIVLYEGPSAIDGAPIVALTADIDRKSKNVKTADEVQTYILRQDVKPNAAIKSGEDTSICGGCAHRSEASGGSGACYVIAFRGPLAVWSAYKRGNVIRPSDAEISAMVADRTIRLGSYGNPSAIPADRWEVLLAQSKGHTGYDHRWRDSDPAVWAHLVMASVDTPDEAREAIAMGYRTFRTRLPDEVLMPHERVCPASHEFGQVVTCEQCRGCDGTRRGQKRKSYAIMAHGPMAKRYEKWRSSL